MHSNVNTQRTRPSNASEERKVDKKRTKRKDYVSPRKMKESFYVWNS